MLKLGTYKVDKESKDYSRSRNGGEYEFGHTPVLNQGVDVGCLFSTSSSLDYCEIRATFTKTKRVDVKRANIIFFVDVQMDIADEITEVEFIDLLSRWQ